MSLWVCDLFAVQVELSQCPGTNLHILHFLYVLSVILTVLSLLYKVMFLSVYVVPLRMCSCVYMLPCCVIILTYRKFTIYLIWFALVI